ncbi:hypothetical protein [Spirosoma pomorum]
MTPIKWIIVALAILGLGGLIYWLLIPKTTPSTSGQGSALGFLANLFGPSSSSTTTTTITWDNPGGGGYVPPATGVDDGDKGGGNYTANPNWYFGEYGAMQGTDFEGRPYVATSAPVIPFEVKNSPYTFGVDYPYPEQTAKGVANLRRFPEFNLPANKLHIMGPWYNDGYANESNFSRGVTSIVTLPNFRSEGAPQSIVHLPRSQKNDMIGDPVLHAIARTLAAGDPTHPNADAWAWLGHSKTFTPNQAAYMEIGRQLWNQERSLQDVNNQGVTYICVDMEDSHPWELNRFCVGSVYLGLCQAAAEEGLQVIPYLYSNGIGQVGIIGFSDVVNGFPEYLQDRFDWFNNEDTLVQALNQYNGVATVDTYIQAVWGLEDFLARDESGNAYTDGQGEPVFSSLGQTTVYGQVIYLEPGEAKRALQDLYEQSTRLYLMNHRLAGAYPVYGGQRRPSLVNAQMGSFTRNSNEGVDGTIQNDRPVPAWQLEMFNSMNLFLSNHIYCWGVDFNHEPGAVGADHSSVWSYQAHGTMESIVRALHRRSAFAQIQTAQFKWLWFNLAIVNNLRADGNTYSQKALTHGKILNVNGAAWLELWFAFPCADNKPKLFTVWVTKNGVQSEPFQCWIQSGRHYFYDAFPLPGVFSYDQLEGADVCLHYVDEHGVNRYFRGDYRVDASGLSVPNS